MDKNGKKEKKKILSLLKEALEMVLESEERLEIETVMLEDGEVFNHIVDKEPEIDSWWLGAWMVIGERATFDYDIAEIKAMSEEERREKVDWENLKKDPELAYEMFIEELEKDDEYYE